MRSLSYQYQYLFVDRSVEKFLRDVLGNSGVL